MYRLVVEAHQLRRLQCNHGIRPTVSIRELDLIYAGHPALNDGAQLGRGPIPLRVGPQAVRLPNASRYLLSRAFCLPAYSTKQLVSRAPSTILCKAKWSMRPKKVRNKTALERHVRGAGMPRIRIPRCPYNSRAFWRRCAPPTPPPETLRHWRTTSKSPCRSRTAFRK